MKLQRDQSRSNDRRTWLLLLLALVPTASILLAGLWLWSARGAEIENVEAAQVPVDASVALYRLGSGLLASDASLRAAALPDAGLEVIDRAQRDRAVALQAIERSTVELEPLVPELTDGGDEVVGPVLELIGTHLGQAVQVIEQQEPGDPLSPAMGLLSTLSRDTTGGIVLPYAGVSDVDVGFRFDVLATTIRYQADYDYDRNAILQLVESSPVNIEAEFDVIAASRMRNTHWKALVDGRTYARTDDSEPGWEATEVAIDSPFLLDRTEPIAELLASAGALDSAAERDALLLGLFEIGDALDHDVELAATMFVEASASHVGGLEFERTLTVAASAIMGLLGLSLSWLTVAEVQHRRRVERAHAGVVNQLDEEAHRDPTTGAWNRRRLETELARMLDECETQETNNNPDDVVVLAYLDLDHFKAVNDVWGHHTGDEILRTVTRRLRNVSYQGERFELSRFGGDEFVLYGRIGRKPDGWLERLGSIIIDTISRPIQFEGREHTVGVSAGITVSDSASTIDSLLLEADSSLILAKCSQRGSAIVYDRATSRTGELVHALPDALSDGEVTCHLQPVFDSRTGEVLHVEALARWIRASGEVVSPAVFVPLVESFGMADRLTSTMMASIRDVLLDVRTPHDIRVWVNLSPLELEVTNFARRFQRLLFSLGVSPDRVGVEITESSAVRDPKRLAIELRRLREIGVMIAIDDFGNGYTPLGYLRDLPVDVVKLDRSLVANIDTDASNQHLVTGIVGMLQEYGMGITAEGVEREAEELWLGDHGVSQIQGFLRGRPVPPDQLEWVQTNTIGYREPVTVA